MRTVSGDKNHEATIPVKTIYEKLGEYYNPDQIDSILKGILNTLGFEKKESYAQEDFLKICREMKDEGGNARFCASLLVIDAILKK